MPCGMSFKVNFLTVIITPLSRAAITGYRNLAFLQVPDPAEIPPGINFDGETALWNLAMNTQKLFAMSVRQQNIYASCQPIRV